MSVTREDVARFAALAKLALADDELDGLTRDLNDVLAYVRTLQDASVAEDGGETTWGSPSGTRPAEGTRDELALAPEQLAPRWSAGHFVVPPPPGVQAEGETDA